MITVKDIVDADQVRLRTGKKPLLTAEGRRVLENLVTILRPIPQAEIDAIIRGSLKEAA